jgi:hypothetical protein
VVTMSGTQRTAELVGELVYVSSEAAKHTAKVLRARGRLWPSPGRGVRNATFTVTHLTNLLLALGCGEPVRAVETVSLFGGLRLVGVPSVTRLTWVTNPLQPPEEPTETNIKTRLADELPQMVPGTLGETLDFVVAGLADPSVDEGLRNVFRTSEVWVTIKPNPRAEFRLRMGGETFTWTYKPLPAQPDLPIPVQEYLKSSELRRAFNGHAFEKLATIWYETATSPAREAAAARDQPARADGCRAQAHPIGERERSQSRRVGHSHQPPKGVADVRQGVAHGAAA